MKTINVSGCPFCSPNVDREKIILENNSCFYLQSTEPVLTGSGLIIPKSHRLSVFDLDAQEWLDTFALLQLVKARLDEQYAPDGYNIGWNCGEVGGQEIFHAHLHVIARYRDEPLAGKGIRYWLRQETNRRGN